jgi:hypothetical protein
MSGRSNWEAKNAVLGRLDPARRAEAEARAGARKTNDAFKVDAKEETAPAKEAKIPRPLPGLMPMIRAGKRKQDIDDAVGN